MIIITESKRGKTNGRRTVMNGTTVILTTRRPFPMKLSRITTVLLSQPRRVRRVPNIGSRTQPLAINRRLFNRLTLKTTNTISSNTTIARRRGKGLITVITIVLSSRPPLVSASLPSNRILPTRPLPRFTRLNNGKQFNDRLRNRNEEGTQSARPF